MVCSCRIVRKYTWYTAYSVAYQLKDFCCPGYKQVGSECKAICHRLCYNGGTCVGPDRCQCANGWSGQYCTMFWICSPKCENGGTCVRGLICQCADGWKGSSCTIPSGRNNSWLTDGHYVLPSWNLQDITNIWSDIHSNTVLYLHVVTSVAI
jgi:hypothetical protein